MISVVVPTFNRLDSLKICIDSIIDQYYDGLELIVIDDCSSDGTTEYLRENFSSHSFVRIIINEKNRGVNYSRNRGIDLATQPFILFIDSDDFMAVGSLMYVKSTIEKNPATSHFLFLVSDRKQEFESISANKYINYGDWLSGRTSGDFTHVIKSSVIKEHLFFEQFRMYEHLNWLRVKKLTSPQLLVPFVVADRDRDREDCLTNTMKLRDINVIRSKFESEKIYYSMYHDDLRQHNPSSLNGQLIQAIALGTACNQKRESRALLKYAQKFRVRFLSGIILSMPSSFLQFGIIRYSAYKAKKALN